MVVQTSYGDIEFGFYPTVAPKTVDHIFKLVRLGGYNTNHFFRVYGLKAQALMKVLHLWPVLFLEEGAKCESFCRLIKVLLLKLRMWRVDDQLQ